MRYGANVTFVKLALVFASSSTVTFLQFFKLRRRAVLLSTVLFVKVSVSTQTANKGTALVPLKVLPVMMMF